VQKVFFSNADKVLRYPHKRAIKFFVEHLFQNEKKPLQRLDYVFCSDDYLIGINRRFLQHDYYTDIITFDLSAGTNVTMGEIYISLDRVKDNATELKVPFVRELERVVFHGALHLCGYKDKKKSEIANMRNLENHYMRLYEQTLTSS
jgi:probable rRNA maturation factor